MLPEYFPSDNEYGIPSLRPDRQSLSIRGPVKAWGSVSRSAQMPGTWVFYCDDYRFDRLLNDPVQIVYTNCIACVEPNISLFEQSTKAEAIWATFRKRTCARKWQDLGIDLLVDLNVPERYHDVCLLGVPRSWQSFATRGYHARIPELVKEIELALSWNDNSTVLVYGGGKEVEKTCTGYPGAVYVPSHMSRLKGTK